MHPGVEELARFYESPLGQITRRLVLRRLHALWPDTHRMRVLGFGYAGPYLRAFAEGAERVAAANPAQQGARVAPSEAGIAPALVEEDALPFADEGFERILVVHGLETSDSVRRLMRELWRVLAAEGRLLLVVPNRASLWAQLETSPFGHGRPYSRAQLARMLGDAMFEPLRWESALHMPPFRGRRIVRTGTGWERVGRAVWPWLAGVHVVEAGKSLYAGVPASGLRVRKRVLAGAER